MNFSISENDIETQEELLAYLLKEGFAVTQATVSRDIKELHLYKQHLFHDQLLYLH